MKIQFFCLQPIKLSKSIFTDVNLKKYSPHKEEWMDITNPKNTSKLKEYNLSTKWFSEIKAIQRHKIYAYQTDYLKFNLDLEQIRKLEIFDKNLYVNKEDTGFVLCYDYDYKVFFLILCLSFDVSDSMDPNRLTSLYLNIRNQLVIDSANGNNEISKWANSIHSFAIREIYSEFNTTEKSGKIEILENSGYLCSLYPDFNTLNVENNIQQYKEDFLENNHNIDLIDEKKYQYAHFSISKGACKGLYTKGNNVTDEELFNNCKSIVFLGWRYTTLYGIKEDKDIKLLALLINIQNIYFQIDNFYKPYLSSLYEDVRYSNDYVSLSENLEFFDKLVVAFQNLVYEKENFVSELKPFQVEAFRAIEDYWGLTKDYDNIDKTLNICQTSLERKLNIKNNRIQQKQSDILFVLAIIQIFSILGILLDYHNLLSLDLIELYIDKNNILYVLGSLSVVLIIFAYMEKFWYSINKILRRLGKIFQNN